jgi:aryl-phospho-beta-D-glucosidase BglC (GH1 family)
MHHLWLVPLLFTTPGNCYEGYSNVCGIWNSAAEQNALTAFWVEVATHYAHEPVVAGYDLLNEPNPPSVLSQWWPLAQRIRDAIRTVDPNHFVVIESASDAQFWKTLGPNVVYSVHGYAPLSLTHARCCTYPGPAPDWNGTIRNWNHDSIGQMMLDRMSIRWSQQANVPLWIGEWGTKRYPGYDRYLADHIDLMNNVWHVHYAHFLWRSGVNDFGLYECAGFACPDAAAVNAIRPGFSGNVMR